MPHALCAAVLAWSRPAPATYSLISTDSANGEVGGFVVSCVLDDFDLSEVLRPSDDYIVAAQGYFFEPGRDVLVSALAQGVTPQEALAMALSSAFDPPRQGIGPTYRQYAALTIDGSVAQHSGSDLSAFAGHKSGSLGSITYALQGNILTDSAVLDRLEEGFLTSGATIAEKSVSALRALASSGGGDSRCFPLSGDAGYFVLRRPNAPSFEISVRSFEEGEEVARSLALLIEAKSVQPSNEAEEPDESGAHSSAEKRGGCNYSRGGGSAAIVLWVVLWGFLVGRLQTAPRRATRRQL